MKCECCGEVHRDIHWLAGWLEGADYIVCRFEDYLSDENWAMIGSIMVEYEAAYVCLYAQTIGGGE